MNILKTILKNHRQAREIESKRRESVRYHIQQRQMAIEEMHQDTINLKRKGKK